MPDDPALAKARDVRIDQMIEQYRMARQRRLVHRAKRLQRQADANHQFARLEAPPERVH
jgi:hypothetical protein